MNVMLEIFVLVSLITFKVVLDDFLQFFFFL